MRYPIGTEIEAEAPPHGGRWERLANGKLRLLETTYPQSETPAEAAARATAEAQAAPAEASSEPARRKKGE